MKAVIQKVKKCVLYSDGKKYSEIGEGELVLFGVSADDKRENVKAFADKLLKLRIFDDENGKTNKALADINGEMMVVSNFTLYASLKGTNRPDFIYSAKKEDAEQIYNEFCNYLMTQREIKTGVFHTYMEMETVLDGPGTYILEM